MYFLDFPSTGHMSRPINTKAVAMQKFNECKTECVVYFTPDDDELADTIIICEKGHMPVHGPEGDEFVMDVNHWEEQAEYVQL